jgi:hypothetical protein
MEKINIGIPGGFNVYQKECQIRGYSKLKSIVAFRYYKSDCPIGNSRTVVYERVTVFRYFVVMRKAFSSPYLLFASSPLITSIFLI